MVDPGAILGGALLARIRDLHSGPGRGYHGWSHPVALLELFAESEASLSDPLAVYCAILLHDAVYKPRRTDNEARSAELARELLAGVVPPETLARAVRLIEATALHAIPQGIADAEREDMARFLDMDLSILGASDDAFDAYEAGVRHEYRDVPDDAFHDARAKILEGFLARDALFLSDWGRARFEAPARCNLARSIAQLRRRPAPLAELIDASHLWALGRAREAIHRALSGHDRTLPPLAELRRLQLPGAGGPLEGRLYRPVGVGPDAPLLLYFHGGGFVVSDLDTHEALGIRLAAAGGMRVLAARYRLAPEHRFPAQLDDAVAVTRWVLGEGVSRLNLRRGAAIGGDSAGGYLAASAAARVKADHPGALRAQLLLYPLLQMDGALWAKSLLKETRLVGWAAVQYINAQLLEAGDSAPSLLSPADLAPIPSVIAVGGALDPCKADAAQLTERLRGAGREVVWREYPALIHGFGNLTHVSEAARRAVAEIGGLLGGLMNR